MTSDIKLGSVLAFTFALLLLLPFKVALFLRLALGLRVVVDFALSPVRKRGFLLSEIW